MKQRREAFKSLATIAVTTSVLPNQWLKPVINSIILPAHAQTSCSGFTTSDVNESLTLVVTDTTVSGPIMANRSLNTFNEVGERVIDSCRDTQTLNVRVEFSGEINSTDSSITGTINILQTCGSEFVCEQISSFTATQTPVNSASDNGDYTGTVIGTLVCCDDFNVTTPISS